LHDSAATGFVSLYTIAGLVALAIWVSLAFFRGRFWSVQDKLLPTAALAALAETSVAVVIPARNEAQSIGSTVSSLLEQRYPGTVHIFVVDDESTDLTAGFAQKAAAEANMTDRVTVLQAGPRPAGWTGKMWAVSQGVTAANAKSPAYLLLTDADIDHHPDNLAQLTSLAILGHYALTSVMVKLHCRTLAEHLLIPAFVYFFFLLHPPASILNERSRTSGAAGGCMLITPAALEAAGGIAAIASEIIDDCALARAVKRSGGKIWLGLTPQTHSHRVYEDFGEVEGMISRTAFNQLRHSTLLLAGTVLGLIATYLLPLALLLFPDHLAAALGAASWLLMSATYLPMVRFYRLPAPWALTLPAAAVFYLVATVHSAIKHWQGRGGEWKGRAQDVAS
jgi:hopene-associated glycosyltransferase HpnB